MRPRRALTWVARAGRGMMALASSQRDRGEAFAPGSSHAIRGPNWPCGTRPGVGGAPLAEPGPTGLPMSILDMIGPVMIGPSSSHTAGACRIGLLARAILDATREKATITLHGSFAKTGRGHGTDRALVAGILGMRPDDGRLPQALAEAEKAGLALSWAEANLGNVHPNPARLGPGRGG